MKENTILRVAEIKSYYFVSTVREHAEYKKKLLNEIDEMPSINVDQPHEKIDKTDFWISSLYKRKYLDTFYGIISPYMIEICNQLKNAEWKIHNAWFQQYEKQGKHGWHTHPETNWTNVYYLELPNPNLKTEIYDSIANKIIDTIEINEGDILTVPAYFLHKSKENDSNKRKTIISFNSSFTGADEIAIEKLLGRTNG